MQTTDRRAYLEAILCRLRRAYADRALLPTGAPLSLATLQRLFRAVIREYGDA